MQGWIKLHRDFTKFEWYQDANTMRVFLHLLITANHKDAKWQGNTINRGQLITSHGNLANDLGLSIQNVRTSLSKLKKSGNVTVKSTSKFTLLSVCNYDTYQSQDSSANTPTNRPLTDDQQTANRRLTTNKNDNNENNEKNEEKESKPLPFKSEDQLRIEKLFGKRVTTPMDKAELSAWASSKAIVADMTEREWVDLEVYCAAPQDKTYRRKSLATLLNNLSGELDKAVAWSQQHTNTQTKQSTETLTPIESF
jgi:hypothetical protein|tara:strand:+ start:565 stop:1323 length:759 start_codon:yes stop_codon:yes gene_type:complete